MCKDYFFEVWELKSNKERYEVLMNNCLQSSPYHSFEYLAAEEKAEDYNICIAELHDNNEKFAFIPIVIKRINDLAYMSDLQQEYYDLITPHEYSAIMSNTEEEFKIKLLLKLKNYCEKNNIVFQFYRINPYFCGQQQVYEKAGFQVVKSSNQVYVDLTETWDVIWANYKSNVRRNIRRAEKEGLVFEIATVTEKAVYTFMEMYQKAMDILEARRFLYFNYEYFTSLLNIQNSKLAFIRNKEQKVIAAGIVLVDKVSGTAYYHLGCFDREYTLMRPMNFLIHSMIMWCYESGMKYFHLGGGGKSLLQFKEGYGKKRISYYIAYDGNMRAEYEKVTEHWRKKFSEYEESFFLPIYRINE